jgi:hypothetical protein
MAGRLEIDLFNEEQRAFFEKMRARNAASIERAAQRERDLYPYPGNATAQKVAREMWRAFIAEPEMVAWSFRQLAERFSTSDARVSYITAHRIRMWIVEHPRPLGPPIVSDEIAEKLREWRKKIPRLTGRLS